MSYKFRSSSTKDDYVVEKHPFEPFLSNDTSYLVLGTFPTYISNLSYNFYYSNKENNFWKILEKVFNHNFLHHADDKAVHERQSFLKDNKIGVTDMHEVCYRRNKSSSDKDLYTIQLRNIFSILDRHPSISRLILTSRTEVFGALGLLKTLFLQHDKPFPDITRRGDKILESKFIYADSKIEIVVPYSPSPRLIADKVTTMEELITMYTFCLGL